MISIAQEHNRTLFTVPNINAQLGKWMILTGLCGLLELYAHSKQNRKTDRCYNPEPRLIYMYERSKAKLGIFFIQNTKRKYL